MTDYPCPMAVERVFFGSLLPFNCTIAGEHDEHEAIGPDGPIRFTNEEAVYAR